MSNMEKGPDNVWRPSRDLKAESPYTMSDRKKGRIEKTGQIADPNPNPEEMLLRKEEEQAEDEKERKTREDFGEEI